MFFMPGCLQWALINKVIYYCQFHIQALISPRVVNATYHCLALSHSNDSEPAAYVNKVDLVPGSSYVAVIYDDVWWPGLVQSVTEDSAVISFMMPLKTENKFKWPKKSQIEIVKISEILAVIQCVPEPVNQRGTFCFPSDEADRLTKLMNKISD